MFQIHSSVSRPHPDNALNLNKWTFASRVLAPGEYMVVFASDDDMPDPSGKLHTNFGFSAGGEYLALVAPDGETIASAFNADGTDYLDQYEDVSFGVSSQVPIFSWC